MSELNPMESKNMKFVRVWNKEGKYIGDFEVPIEFPSLVEFAGKDQPYQVPSL